MKTPEEFAFEQCGHWNGGSQTHAVAAAIRDYLRQFRDEVNARAEQKMLTTGKLEGAHFAAMRQIFTEIGIDK